MRYMNRTVFTLLASFSALAFSACSNFDARFARGVPAPKGGDRLSGTYEGNWSSSTGGGGKLWCILQRQKNATYLAEFRATWHGVFASQHSVVLHSKRARTGAGSHTFHGTAALDTFIGSGTYRCEGTMDGKRMRACYDATYDRGTFDLQRVAPSSR